MKAYKLLCQLNKVPVPLRTIRLRRFNAKKPWALAFYTPLSSLSFQTAEPATMNIGRLFDFKKKKKF
jgi:hypothetical protein